MIILKGAHRPEGSIYLRFYESVNDNFLHTILLLIASWILNILGSLIGVSSAWWYCCTSTITEPSYIFCWSYFLQSHSYRLRAQMEYCLFTTTDQDEPVLPDEWSRLDISTEVGEYEKYIKGREDHSADPVDALRHHSELPERMRARSQRDMKVVK